MGLSILVTGGLGFIGSNFIRYLLKSYGDIQITNLDAVTYGANSQNLQDLEGDSRYRFVKADIVDKYVISKHVARANAIVNFASETHVDRSISDPEPFLRSNVIGTYGLLETVKKSNLQKFIHISTDEVYGAALHGKSFNEEDRLNPSSPYSASKAAADMYAHAYHRTYGINTIIVRCTNNFGPYQFPEKLIPKTIIRAASNLSVPLYGNGAQVRDWIYVLDFCEALEKLMNDGKPGEIYNVAGGNELSNLELAEMILTLFGKPKDIIEFVEDRPGHDIRYSLDSSKITRELGWRPKHSFEEALASTVKWYVNNESWWKPLVNEKILSPTPWKEKW